MLELRPNCEWCDRDLPPDSPHAMICSYECTYCEDCVRDVLHDVCPTCGGNLVRRPIRPLEEWRPGSGLGRRHHPPSTQRRHSRWSAEEVAALSQRLHAVAPANR
ncbi:DUF1272 domain-containing protein [Fulvimonas yonginensis]|uniref:DUF1272 domain-containing protein n=1 Tax=Fulvimonas yonginensis TaxID=1495200 RepID=A0ABU8J901_9GAMM